MKPSFGRTVLAGLVGGLAFNLTMFVTYRLIGFGLHGQGILMDPKLQSPKLISVWTTPPLPRVLQMPPALIMVCLLGVGIIHAFFYRLVASVWPAGVVQRALHMAFWVFLLVFVFWEFFTPFNQLHEPLPLIGLELFFWLLIATAEALAIAAVMERKPADRRVKVP